MSYTPRPYADIKAARQKAILFGAPLIPKCHCHMCDCRIAAKELFCSGVCATDYHEEVASLSQPAKHRPA